MNYEELFNNINLMILHDCLTPEGAKDILERKSLEMLLTADCGGVPLKKRIEELASSTDCFSEGHIEKLTELRKILLGS